MWMPAEGSVEAWAHDYVTSESLAHKLCPPPAPRDWDPEATALVLEAPGRSAELVVATRGTRTPGPNALREPARRAELLHTFLHHELQAAELMCRTLLAYPEAPQAFRRGLLGICLDELRHMRMYADHLDHLGFAFGDLPVNDWFWRRVPSASSPTQFVALMGLGFEGANLDHTARFAARFAAAGDSRGAALQLKVGEEEVPHVAFGAHWFEKLSGGPLTFERWKRALPPPLSPMLMRGRPIDRAARARAGMSPEFLDALAGWEPTP